mmetsp:Transcript_50792/g.107784  ORF Transcript_50792/g.107784 Transcript_50792/m.107784 type:complete len:209 (-) Transcript_50792:370-996(-)
MRRKRKKLLSLRPGLPCSGRGSQVVRLCCLPTASPRHLPLAPAPAHHHQYDEGHVAVLAPNHPVLDRIGVCLHTGLSSTQRQSSRLRPPHSIQRGGAYSRTARNGGRCNAQCRRCSTGLGDTMFAVLGQQWDPPPKPLRSFGLDSAHLPMSPPANQHLLGGAPLQKAQVLVLEARGPSGIWRMAGCTPILRLIQMFKKRRAVVVNDSE